MSRADIETLRLAYQAASRGDWEAVLESMDPDLEVKTIRTGTHRGREEVRRFLEDMTSGFEDTHFEPEQFFDRGDRIAVFVRLKARPSGADGMIENRIGHLWTMRKGRPVRCETFPRREDALEAMEAGDR
jgi:ketosteroid isomerase-like protein